METQITIATVERSGLTRVWSIWQNEFPLLYIDHIVSKFFLELGLGKSVCMRMCVCVCMCVSGRPPCSCLFPQYWFSLLWWMLFQTWKCRLGKCATGKHCIPQRVQWHKRMEPGEDETKPQWIEGRVFQRYWRFVPSKFTEFPWRQTRTWAPKSKLRNWFCEDSSYEGLTS